VSWPSDEHGDDYGVEHRPAITHATDGIGERRSFAVQTPKWLLIVTLTYAETGG
jgi:hypothetical protein